jgi:hypothetical protein
MGWACMTDEQYGDEIETDGGRALITYCEGCSSIHRANQPCKPW